MSRWAVTAPQFVKRLASLRDHDWLNSDNRAAFGAAYRLPGVKSFSVQAWEV